MGHVYCDVDLKGTKAKKRVRMLVDTGATRTIIPYKLVDEIGVYYKYPSRREVTYGDGNVRKLEIAVIDLKVLDREITDIVLLDNIAEPILGVFSLEAMGIKVNPQSGKIEPSREWIARA